MSILNKNNLNYKPKILIIDDDNNIIKLLNNLLKNDYLIYSNNKSLDAYNTAVENIPDLILLDIKMPDMDGFELCNKIKNNKSTKNIPIIFVSALDDIEKKIKSFDLGAVDYIIKPIRKRELLARIKNHINISLLKKELEVKNKELEKQIIECKHQEYKIKKSEEKHKIISDLTSDFSYSFKVTKSGKIENEWVTGAFTKITGYKKEELIKLGGWESIILQDDLEIPKNQIKCLLNNKENEVEYRITTKNNKIRWIRDYARPVFNKKEKRITHIYGAIKDITKNKEMKEKLKKSEKKYNILVEEISEGYYITNTEGIIEFANNALIKILGYSKQEEVLGKNFYTFLPKHKKNYSYNVFKNAIKSGKFHQFHETKIIKKDGQNSFIEISIQPIYKNDNIIGLKGIINDISERKKIEEERKRLNDQLLEKNKELEQIIYISTHDLRSPLVNIHGFSTELNFVINKLLDEVNKNKNINAYIDDIKECLDYINKSVLKIETLLSSLIRISRLENIELIITEIDMNELINDILDTFDFQIKSKEIKIIKDKIPDCKGDKIKLNQVFSNIIDNSIKYFNPSESSFIKISGKIKENNVVYCIEDNGIGIPPFNIDKIFDIFYRIHPDKYQGEGIGLNIVNKLVKKHNGKVWLESKEGIGTKFYISFPV